MYNTLEYHIREMIRERHERDECNPGGDCWHNDHEKLQESNQLIEKLAKKLYETYIKETK